MRIMGYACVGTLVLAGCGEQSVQLENASVEDVVKATANAQSLAPGQWSTKVEFISVEIPGLPEQEKRIMGALTEAMVGKTEVAENCVTPEQAKQPSAAMFASGGADCTFKRYAVSGGKMDAELLCNAGGRDELNMALTGPFGGAAYKLDAVLTMTGPSGKQMKVVARNSGERTGECKAG